MAEGSKSSLGLGRLVAASLGAAVLAVVLSKLRRRTTPTLGHMDRAESMTATRAERRARLTALPGGRGNPLGTSAAGTGADQPGRTTNRTRIAGRARAIARPVTPTAADPSTSTDPTGPATSTDATTPTAADPTTPTMADPIMPSESGDLPEAITTPDEAPPTSVVQAAVETTEIDPFAWPEPPAPPPVVPADTTLSVLVNDTTGAVSGAGTRSATDAGLSPSDGLIDHHASTDQAGLFDSPGRAGIADPPEPVRPDSTTAASGASSGPFYGWFLVAAVFIILCITSGVGFYNASVILSAATKELGASVGAVSGATGLFFAIGGLTGFVFAKRMEFVDIRWFFVAGGVVGGVALLGLRWVTSIPGLYVFFAAFGVAFGLAGLVPATTLITRWFDRRRSVALSIASTGLSVGGIVVTPFSGWLIDERTLSGAAPYLAAMWVIGVIPMAVLFVRSYPSDKGLRPDGDPPPEDAAALIEPAALEAATFGEAESTSGSSTATAPTVAAPAAGLAAPETVPGLSFARARTTRFFVALCLAYAVIFFGQVGGIAQLYNMILERTDGSTARTALATLAGSSVVFRLLGGAAAIRLPTKSFSAALAVVQAAALILLAVTNSSTGLILSAAFFGCSIGNLLMLQPLLLAEAFGVANYGRIYSFNQLFGTIGLASGPLTLGLIHDASDYRNAFFAAATASFLGCLAIIAAGPTAKVQALWR